VLTSSSSVYGNTPRLPKEEPMAGSPLSPYALQKWTAEGYMRLFHGPLRVAPRWRSGRSNVFGATPASG